MARTIEIAIQEGGTIKLPATQVKSLEKAPIGTKITIKGVQYTKAIPKAIRPARVVLSRQLRPTTRAVEPIFEPKLERFVPAKVIEVDKQKVATPSIELFEIKRPALQEVKEQKAYEVLSRGGVLGESLAKEFDLPQRLVQAPLEEKRKTIFREAFGRPTIREKAIELEETNILTKQFIGRTTIAFAETGRDIGGAIAQPTVFAKETKKFAQELKDPKKLKEFGSDIIKFAQEKPALFAGELVGSAVFFTLTAAALRGGAKATLPAIAITKALRFRKLMRAGKLAGAYKTTKPSKVFILPFALKKGKKVFGIAPIVFTKQIGKFKHVPVRFRLGVAATKLIPESPKITKFVSASIVAPTRTLAKTTGEIPTKFKGVTAGVIKILKTDERITTMFGSAVRQPLTKKKRTKAIFVSVPFKHKFSKRITGQLIAGEVTRITQKSKRIPREPVIRFGAIGFVKDITKPLSRDLIKTKKGQKAITLPSRKIKPITEPSVELAALTGVFATKIGKPIFKPPIARVRMDQMLGQAPKLKVGEQIREKAISKTITQQIALEKQFQQSFFGTITTTQPKVATITKTRLNNLLAETPTPPPPIPPEFPPPPPAVAFDFEKKVLRKIVRRKPTKRRRIKGVRTPSFTALVRQIHGKPRKKKKRKELFTGLELRPIIKRKKRTKLEKFLL